METNPIVKFRQQKGLSRPAFAQAAGCTYDLLEGIERGRCRQLGPTFLAGLRAAGLPESVVERLASDYEAWTAAQTAAVREQLVGNMGGPTEK